MIDQQDLQLGVVVGPRSNAAVCTVCCSKPATALGLDDRAKRTRVGHGEITKSSEKHGMRKLESDVELVLRLSMSRPLRKGSLGNKSKHRTVNVV